MSITVKSGDSPKFYALLKDIYGDALGVSSNELDEFSYSVYRVVNGERFPVAGFVDVEIPASCYHQPPENAPSGLATISGGSFDEYNVEIFPYRAVENDGVLEWKSPFIAETAQGAAYDRVVKMRYLMDDSALSGAAYIDKSFTVRVNAEP